MVIDQSIKVRLITEQLAEMAREKGVSTAMEMIAEATSTNATTNDVRGLDDIARAANDGNAFIAEAGQTAARNAGINLGDLGGSTGIIIVAVVVVLIVLMMSKKKANRGS